MKTKDWYKIEIPEHVISPALLVYPKRIEENISTMIEIAGGTEFLRPHIKTHKIAEIIQLQLKQGISKFKCSTITEAQLLGQCGAKDVLLAMQPVGINIHRFFELIEKYPDTTFSALVDTHTIIDELAKIGAAKNSKVSLWLDINNGMNRTGVLPGKEAVELYRAITKNPNLIAKGLHVYDGHIHDSDFDLRKKHCDNDFEPVIKLQRDIEEFGVNITTIIAGGSPTFPIHKNKKNVETSPGTVLLWDEGYGSTYKDLNFLPSAVLITRVISKPTVNHVCFDLGHKSVASEMMLPRVKFLENRMCTQISQSEEHLVVECDDSDVYEVGDICYALPIHICPTVIKYKSVLTVVDGRVTGAWEVAARDYN